MQQIAFRRTYGDIASFVSGTTSELIIMSPYIKLGALKFLIEQVKPGVKVIIVGRWKLSDLLFGSSDIEVYDYLKQRGHSFYINQKIHLKVAVKDKSEILIGSANITSSGLGLFESGNIEAIALDVLDVKYLPEIYSILRESVPVTDQLVHALKGSLAEFVEANEARAKLESQMEAVEKKLIIKSRTNILVYDFPVSETPDSFLQCFKTKPLNESALHDLEILRLDEKSLTKVALQEAFLNSNAYHWQKVNIKDETLFGRYSEVLHNAILDNPKPYRRSIKELVSNMFNWTSALSQEFEIKSYNHTKSLKLKET